MKLFTKAIDEQLFKQYPLGSDLSTQMVVAKIFNPYGRGTWYLLNSDPQDPDYIWAIVDLFDVEMGSVSRSELEGLKVPPFRLGLERDTFFTPINALTLYQGLMQGKMYEDGGETKEDFLEDVKEMHESIAEITLKDGSKVSGEELMMYGHPKVIRTQFEDEEFEFADGGGIGFIPMDLEEDLRITAKWGGTDIKGVIGILNAMIDSGLTDEDLKPKPTKSGSARQNATDRKTKEIWAKIEPQYKGDFKGNMYFSTIRHLVERANSSDNILKKYKPFRKHQDFANGGKIKNQYEDRTPESIWNNLSKEQRQHFLYDHKVEIEDYRGEEFGTLSSKEIVKAYNSEYKDLDKNIRNRFDNHIREGQYANGGSLEDMQRQMEKTNLLIRAKIVNLIGIDETLNYLAKDFVISPFRLLNAAVNRGLITVDDITVDLWDEAVSEAEEIDERYRDSGEGIGSSDMGYFVRSMLNNAGIEVKMADGGEMMRDGGNIKSNLSSLSLRAKELAKKYGKKGVEKSKEIVKENKRKTAVNVINQTENKTSGKVNKEALDKARKLVIKNYADGGEIMKHKHNEHITIQLIEPTNKGWKVKQIETHSISGKKLSTPKEKVAYFSKDEIKELFQPMMAMGGETTFEEKVKAVKSSLLKRKKVSPKVQKDYGKTYSPKEAEESAKRIVGSRVAKWNEKIGKK